MIGLRHEKYESFADNCPFSLTVDLERDKISIRARSRTGTKIPRFNFAPPETALFCLTVINTHSARATLLL